MYFTSLNSSVQERNSSRPCACKKQEEARSNKPASNSIANLNKPAAGENSGIQLATLNMTNTSWVQRKLQSKDEGGGQPLPTAMRYQMEAGFGADLSQVRLHTGDEAAQLSQELGARAFTHGNNVYFNSGEFQPHTRRGKHLLAHELVHTVQQSSGAATPKVQRMRIGRGRVPNVFQPNDRVRVVPANERSKVNKAIALVRKSATNPAGYPKCHNYFRRNCPVRNSSFQALFNAARVWKSETNGAEAFTYGRPHMAYTRLGYSKSVQELARTFVHELSHHCGIPGGNGIHHKADVFAFHCIGAPAHSLNISAGYSMNGSFPLALFFGYKYFFGQLFNRRIHLNIGGSINFTGILTSLTESLSQGRRQYSNDLGGITLGARFRPGIPWGSRHFGGLSLGANAGFGLGLFRLKRPTNSQVMQFGPGSIVEGSLGAQFYIPAGGRSTPLSLDAKYRMLKPLDAKARAIHTFLISVKFHIP